jgi:hypothetical protein
MEKNYSGISTQLHPLEMGAGLIDRIVLQSIQLYLIRFDYMPNRFELLQFKPELKKIGLKASTIQYWIDRLNYLSAVN